MHKVWVADDDEAIGLILEESLRNAGFDSKIFSNGEDLLNDLEKDQPDLVLLTFRCLVCLAMMF